MVSEVRIYLEGGGDGKDTKGLMRQGFHKFFRQLVEAARIRRTRFQIVACGPRWAAYDGFTSALKSHPQAFNVLLVDAEGPVQQAPWQHLQASDHWDRPAVDDVHCHLMVQAMEAWLLADVPTLRAFYGQGFNANALPKNPHVEHVSKADVQTGLEAATRQTSKGCYHKTEHAPRLLEKLNPAMVRKAAPHCDRLFVTLGNQLGGVS